MDIRPILLEDFDFDLWANVQWLTAAQNMPKPERPLEVMGHIGWASDIWYSRVAGIPFEPDPKLEPSVFEARTSLWKELLAKDDLDRIVSYRSLAGDPYRRTVEAIARHVIDHGTYHRGQLRGLAEAQQYENFPETGLYLFFMDRRLYE
ncbi:MAG TPA: DinB family protein [Fimbriimonas sp.]|nr:DinB family protein [Fimbriimonas sp.]